MRQYFLLFLAPSFLCGLVFSSFAFSESAPSPLQSQNLLIDNFENASTKDLLDGYLGSDTASPGICRFSFTCNDKETFGRRNHSLRIEYDVRPAGSFTFLWLHLGPEGPDGKVRTLDSSRFTYLSFWAKAARGPENFKIELHCDTNKNGRFDAGQDISSGVFVDHYLGKGGLRDQWRKVVIPLSDFSGIKDFSGAIEIVFVFENLRGNRQGTIYVDEMLFGAKKLSPLARYKKDVLQAPVTLRPVTSAASGTPSLMAGMAHPLSARCNPCDGLEGVGFETSWDGGKSWSLVGIDYDISKDNSAISWKVPPLPPTDKVLIRAFSQGIRGQRVEDPNAVELRLKCDSDSAMIKELTRRSFLYFLDNQDPETGLFLDTEGGNASTAVAGFGLAALAIGSHEGWVNPKVARERALRTLQTYLLLQQGESVAQKIRQQKESAPRPKKGALEDMFDFQTTIAVGGGIFSTLVNTPQGLAELIFGKVPPSKDGFFYHFMKPRTATRAGSSEISVVDTTLLLFGALTAGEYFGGAVSLLADKLYRGVQWEKFYDPKKKCFIMGWTPEKGYFPNHWDYYTDEAVLIHILAAGCETAPIPPDSFYAFSRQKGHFGDSDEFVYSWSGALFTHQYASAWLDLRGWQDREGCDWWENSRRAIRANRDFCWYNQDRPQAYGPHRWGISSCQRPEGYVMHFGTLPNGSDELQEDGTISPIACAASIPFIPFEATSDMKHQLTESPFLLGAYGLRNSYNLQRNWFSNVDFGLDTGLLLLCLENFRSALVWKTLQESPIIQRGLAGCGLKRAGASSGASTPPVALPAVPAGSFGTLAHAQELIGSMETLCQRADIRAYAEFLARSDATYAHALGHLDKLKGNGPKITFHREWLRALVAYRQASGVLMRKHFGRMLQRVQDIAVDASQRASELRPYLDYVVGLDLRDYEEGLYAAFLKEVQQLGNPAKALEDFGSYCLQKKKFSMAARTYNDVLELLRRQKSAQAMAEYATHIAEKFFQTKRLDESIAFDRIYLGWIRSISAPLDSVVVSKLSALGKRYQAAGAALFSKECYATVLLSPAKEGKGDAL